MAKEFFHAKGKILLTAEYLVLLGAEALALPLNCGQSLEVETLPVNNGMLHWDAFTPKGLWFSAMLDRHDFTIRASDDLAIAETLAKIFSLAKQQNPHLFSQNTDYSFTTRIDFQREWGFGTSSTLLSTLSQWAKVDPYLILKNTFGGSGYDIACATAQKPILYQLKNGAPQAKEVDFLPSFIENLYFIYLGKKQISSKEVNHFKEKLKSYSFEKEILEVNDITHKMLSINDLQEFIYLISQHEEIISRCISQAKVKDHFPDFCGEMKSLGAWGGDFVLVATEMSFEKVRKYFIDKGLTTIFKASEIVYVNKN